MKKAEEKTKNRKHVVIQETKICNLGSVRYKDELITDNVDPYLLSQGFKYAVQNLPQSFSSKYEQTAYMNFIENWGTVSKLLLCHKSVHITKFNTCSTLFCLLKLARDICRNGLLHITKFIQNYLIRLLLKIRYQYA